MSEGDVSLKIDIADKALSTLDRVGEAVDRITQAEGRAEAAARRLLDALNSGGTGRANSVRGPDQVPASFPAATHATSPMSRRSEDVERRVSGIVDKLAEDLNRLAVGVHGAADRSPAARPVEVPPEKIIDRPPTPKPGTPGNKLGGAIETAATTAMSGPVGALGKLGVAGAAAAAALLAVDSGLKSLTKAVDVDRDATQTRAQKERLITEQFVPFAETVRKFRESLDGTAETLKSNQRRLMVSAAMTQAFIVKESKEVGFKIPQFAAEARMRAYAGAGPVARSDVYDRSTAIGSRRAAEQDVLLPAYDERRRAEIEARAARSNARNLGAQAMDSHRATQAQADRANKAKKHADDLRRAEERSGVRNKGGRSNADTEALLEQDKYAAMQVQEEKLILAAREAGVNAAMKESAVRKANIGLAKAELEILSQREARMTSAAQKVGSMSRAEREMSKSMALMVEEHVKGGGDIADLPSEMVDQAKPFMSERIAKLQENSGAKELGGFARQNPGIDDSVLQDFEKTTVAEVRAQVDKVKADVRVSISLDEAALAKQIAEQMAAWFGPFMKSIETQLFQTKNRIDNNQSQTYNSAG